MTLANGASSTYRKAQKLQGAAEFRGAANVGRSGQVGLVMFKCFLDSNKPADIAVECDFTTGLG